MEEPSMKQDNKLSVLDNIHARTSIRSYQPKEVEDEKIEQLLGLPWQLLQQPTGSLGLSLSSETKKQ